MLKINIVKNNDIIESMTFIGHAMYDDYGKDIVCAAASSALLTTVNAILSFDEEACKYEEKENVTLLNIKKDNITNTLFVNLELMLKDLEGQYPKNIKMNEEEN